MSEDLRLIALTQRELELLTGYKRAADQLKMLKRFRIHAERRPNNTLLVFWRDCLYPADDDAADRTGTEEPAPAPKVTPKKKNTVAPVSGPQVTPKKKNGKK